VRFLESLRGEQRVKESSQPSADDREGKRSAWLGADTPFSPYLGAVTDSTEIVSPLAVPVTLACCQASLFSSADTA
jgi:hypothetical protein